MRDIKIFLRKRVIILMIVALIIILLVGLFAELDKFRRYIWGVEPKVTFLGEDLTGYLRSEVKNKVYQLSSHIITYPIAAGLDANTGKINSELKGKIVDITATVKKITEAKEGSQVAPTTYQITPFLTTQDIKKINHEISTYTTIIKGSQSRKENIKLATELISNQLVLAGEVFSFNQIVGPRTKKRGFKEGPEIINGQLSTGVGGGICQVSSTLYNAVQSDQFKIIERHSHSKEVGYVPKGEDATVAWDYFDFKFKNKLATPIIIKGKVEANRLKITILANKKE
ncbi:putative vancomycin resistance protein [Halobacteroides halobius DSM 5150]|uniref:Putative vancomycin resistance protein n=1 Tax=Halobacteroides halobius (strain ATCC 35273 / DSM 5150 / MD-1) TaxID=748449 RepID=L0K995_HALHC|nr:VanW family protein [Halobacteroides halobius]AGB40688.1 putative vancomycin resistance protein [Halobacteroides halobius DSM 5150]